MQSCLVRQSYLVRQSSGAVLVRRTLPPHHSLHLSVTQQAKSIRTFSTTTSTENEPRTLTIGDVSLPVRAAHVPSLVPHGYDQDFGSAIGQTSLGHLRWLCQKELLSQDSMLVGFPGPGLLRLALRFAELSGREIETVSITRDTTESDLKQRREIDGGTAIYSDQAPVRAAIHGRLLILDGLQKAERNVMPLLNNLLENREMQLEDGRFLVNAERYDMLLAEGATVADLDASRLVRVHPNFRVLALCVPAPPFRGKPLDPPLRSRFQTRYIPPPTASERWVDMLAFAPGADQQQLRVVAGVADAVSRFEIDAFMGSADSGTHQGKVAHFPDDALASVAKVLEAFPLENLRSVLARVYPYFAPEAPVGLAFTKDQAGMRRAAHRALEQFELSPSVGEIAFDPCAYRLMRVERDTNEATTHAYQATFHFAHASGSSGSSEESVVASVTGVVGPGRLADNNIGSSSRFLNNNNNNSGTDIDVKRFYVTEAHSRLVAAMAQDHCAGRDILLVGETGSGKSEITRRFASDLGYSADLFNLYKDMTARDLLQRRATDNKGNTIWEASPLLEAAVQGRMVVLDGLDRLNPDTLTAIHRIVTDREVQLFDGTRLVSSTAVSASAKEEFNNNNNNNNNNANNVDVPSVIMVHPAFRVVALAAPPDDRNRWFTEEVTSMFNTHVLPPLDELERAAAVELCFPNAPRSAVDALLAFASALEQPSSGGASSSSNSRRLGGRGGGRQQQTTRTQNTVNSSVTSVGESLGIRPLSMRQVMRLAKKMDAYPDAAGARLRANLMNATMTQFLPTQQREAVLRLMDDAGVLIDGHCGGGGISVADGSSSSDNSSGSIALEVGADTVRIGDVTVNTHKPSRPELVPSPKFFPIARHMAVLREMLRDLSTGERHLLLLGNQGVGKNKLVDRLLQLLQREREYIQLHRDSTVGSLTLSPNLRDGQIIWEDSPLVKAAREGRVLVVDEADKAPLEVVGVLKCLVEDEEMLLADGRRMLSPARCAAEREQHGANAEVVEIHPEFCMFVLANRPGVPFLGNDVNSMIGDVFSSHEISNPDRASELQLLKAYGPDVAPQVLDRLTRAFEELRELVEEGVLNYPFSTREAVSVVKHLNEFPEDGVVETLGNILAMDAFHPQQYTAIAKVFQHNHIPVPLSTSENSSNIHVSLQRPASLPPARATERWQ